MKTIAAMHILESVSAKEWCKRNPGLRIKLLPCDCGNQLKATVPWISEQWVGFLTPECSVCGVTGAASTLIAREDALNQELVQLVNSSRNSKPIDSGD